MRPNENWSNFGRKPVEGIRTVIKLRATVTIFVLTFL